MGLSDGRLTSEAAAAMAEHQSTDAMIVGGSNGFERGDPAWPSLASWVALRRRYQKDDARSIIARKIKHRYRVARFAGSQLY